MCNFYPTQTLVIIYFRYMSDFYGAKIITIKKLLKTSNSFTAKFLFVFLNSFSCILSERSRFSFLWFLRVASYVKLYHPLLYFFFCSFPLPHLKAGEGDDWRIQYLRIYFLLIFWARAKYNIEIYITYFAFRQRTKGDEKDETNCWIDCCFPYTIYMKMTVHVNIWIW